MNMLKKLWGAMKEPLEEAAKASIRMLFAPSVSDPTKLASVLPADVRDDYLKWLANPGNKLMATRVIQAGEALALSAAEKINPED